jgi:hypothetical protein
MGLNIEPLLVYTCHILCLALMLLKSLLPLRLVAGLAAPWSPSAGTKEHKARESGDPAYHMGNVGSDDHRVHTGFGITGKMQPKINKAHETKAQTKERLNQHVLRGHDIHELKKPLRGKKRRIRIEVQLSAWSGSVCVPRLVGHCIAKRPRATQRTQASDHALVW